MSNSIHTGFDVFGADAAPAPSFRVQLPNAFALAVGAGAALVFRAHPVLAFIDGIALASNVQAIGKGERTVRAAAKRMGKHVVATAGSLALPAFPVIGYIAGAVAGDLLLDDDGSGLLDDWARLKGEVARARDTAQKVEREVIDVTPVETTSAPDDKTKALVKVNP